MPFPQFQPNFSLFVQQMAALYGDRELLVYEGQRITYAEAEARSAQLARGLLAVGVTKGARLGLLMPNSPDFLVSLLAAARIGALVIPINTFFKSTELGRLLRHADIEILLTVDRLLSHDYLARLEKCLDGLADADGAQRLMLPEAPYLRQVFCWGESKRRWCRVHDELFSTAQQVPKELLAAVEAQVTPADLACIVYSSGSTAAPKGAVHSQGSVIRHAYNVSHWRDVIEGDRVYTPMPFFWVGGLVYSLLGAMHRGACLICEEHFEPAATLALLERENVTVGFAWPHHVKSLLDHPERPQRKLFCIRGGNIQALAPDYTPPADPGLRTGILGMTETCGPHSIERTDVDLHESLRGSFGRPLEGIERKIVDPDSGTLLDAGEHGEICVRGYNLMQGLYKVEREDVFAADGYYHTGDGGQLNEDGVLFFTGRLGDMIKTSGANVAPRDVEIELETQPEVQGAHVVGLPHPDRGEDVVAAVVLNSGLLVDERKLRARLKEVLASYMIPRQIIFYEKSELPYTDSGKIDKRRLVAQLDTRLNN